MLKHITVFILFLLSLLAIFPTPEEHIWYVTILVTEFPWIFLFATIATAIWVYRSKKFRTLQMTICMICFVFFAYPPWCAYLVGYGLPAQVESQFGKGSTELHGLHQSTPFSFWRMLWRIGAGPTPYNTYIYSSPGPYALSLDYYPSLQSGTQPCIVVVHGGSWRSGNSHELPDIDWYLSRQGYNVASINYRLAPQYKSPAPIEDVAAALSYLKANSARLRIDTNNFVLLGRSAGGHIVLQSAYTLKGQNPGIRGVVGLYGPTDLVWAYNHPDNPMVMHSDKVLEDFIGGPEPEMVQQYIDASPINFVTSQSVPTLLIHGVNDAHVNYMLSEMLDKKLEQNHVKHILLSLPWATHGCEYSLKGPSGQLAKYTIERFIYAVTKGAKH